MRRIYLKDVYYCQNNEVKEYKNIFLETDLGVLRCNISTFNFVNIVDLQSMNRLWEIDGLKDKYGVLDIEEVRKTHDNDIYILLAGQFILAIEYVLNSNFQHSTQEFRIIDNIASSNQAELYNFKELEIVELPARRQ